MYIVYVYCIYVYLLHTFWAYIVLYIVTYYKALRTRICCIGDRDMFSHYNMRDLIIQLVGGEYQK